jgi:hypothetical protein
MKKIHLTDHIPGLDDYELPAEFPFDPAKMKPNRFAKRAKATPKRDSKKSPIATVNANAKRIPELDDDELRPHYDIDYRKTRRNPYAGRVKLSVTHGGKRNGAGRKQSPEPIERHTITLYKTHAKFLRGLDANLSRAIRKLIAKAQ